MNESGTIKVELEARDVSIDTYGGMGDITVDGVRVSEATWRVDTAHAVGELTDVTLYLGGHWAPRILGALRVYGRRYGERMGKAMSGGSDVR